MKRKQQFLKTAAIFGHNYNRKPYNISVSTLWSELRNKALYFAFNLPDDLFWNLSRTEELSGEREYYTKTNKRNYRKKDDSLEEEKFHDMETENTIIANGVLWEVIKSSKNI